MTDPLARDLTDRVAAAMPTTLPPFDEVLRRGRRQRVRGAVAVAASTAVVAGVLVGSWSLVRSDSAVQPGEPLGSPSAGEGWNRSDPTYRRSTYPSGLVVRLPDRDVDLPADTSCWTGPQNCRRGLLMTGGAPDLGRQDDIDFWFARPGWTFSAQFRRLGVDCPRATTVQASSAGGQWFQLTPADEAGQYVVDLYGDGPEGIVSTRFLWTTTSDGPLDPPQGSVLLAQDSRGEGSYALEVMMDDLDFQPTRTELSDSVEVSVTAANGQESTVTSPLIESSLECGENGSRGSFYYQGEWDEDIAVLGPPPLDLMVTLTIRGTSYVGRATWEEVVSRSSSYIPMTFTPSLPGAGED